MCSPNNDNINVDYKSYSHGAHIFCKYLELWCLTLLIVSAIVQMWISRFLLSLSSGSCTPSSGEFSPEFGYNYISQGHSSPIYSYPEGATWNFSYPQRILKCMTMKP